MTGAAVRDYLRMMAQYHRWANGRLVESLASLADEDYFRECGLFFGSIHGTINHLIIAERIWHDRLTRGTTAVQSLRERPFASRDATIDAFIEECARWNTLLDAWDDTQLYSEHEYRNLAGKSLRGLRWHTLTHVFNHATHHRGQISAAATIAGAPAPEMDLLYYIRPNV